MECSSRKVDPSVVRKRGLSEKTHSLTRRTRRTQGDGKGNASPEINPLLFGPRPTHFAEDDVCEETQGTYRCFCEVGTGDPPLADTFRGLLSVFLDLSVEFGRSSLRRRLSLRPSRHLLKEDGQVTGQREGSRPPG